MEDVANWRGPVWFPINFMILRALHQLYLYYGDDFKVECPTGSGKLMTLLEIGFELGDRLISIFTRNADGDRPVYGGKTVFNKDPNWRDLVLFYEYFHGDIGAGIGASHQTGWTGLVARFIQLEGGVDKDAILHSAAIRDAILKDERSLQRTYPSIGEPRGPSRNHAARHVAVKRRATIV